METRNMSVRDTLLALSVVIVWALNFLVIRVGLQDLPPLFFAGLRFTITALPAVFFIDRQGIPWRLIVGAGSCIGVGYFSLLFVGMKLGMPPGFAALVSQGQVMFTALFAMVLLRERLTRMQAAGMILGMCGLGLAGLERMGVMNIWALLLVIGAAGFWGLGNVLIRRMGKGLKVDGFRLVLWMSLIPPIPNFLLSAWLEQGQWERFAHLSGTGIFAVAYTAFASTLFGWGAWAWLLRRYAAPQIAPFSLLVPVVALIMSVLWMDEIVSPRLALASGLLLGGVGLTVCGPMLVRFKKHAGPVMGEG